MTVSKRRSGPIIPLEQLRDGYGKAIDSAFALLQASLALWSAWPTVALGLAQLGQEELGKSLSILAAHRLGQNETAWEWFWRPWTDHKTKAYRAFLYELISPTRIEIRGQDGTRLAGASMREAIQHEKEFAFYVNFDRATERFTAPGDVISPEEAFHRITTLLYLGVTADRIRRTLDTLADTAAFEKFSDIAFRICSEGLYQEDMPAVFLEFASRTPEHARLIHELEASLIAGCDWLRALIESKGPNTRVDAEPSA